MAKIKMLALHGMRTSGKVLEQQVSELIHPWRANIRPLTTPAGISDTQPDNCSLPTKTFPLR